MSNGLVWNQPVNGSRRDPDGEPEGEIFNPDKFDNHSSLKLVAKEGMNVLTTHYPGHMWAIQINQFGRVLHVFNHALHDQWGYLIHLSEVEHLPTRKVFLHAGGIILERFGLKPGKFDINEYAKLKKDPKGRCVVVYLSDLECDSAKKALKKRALDEAIIAGNTLVDSTGRVLVAVQGG